MSNAIRLDREIVEPLHRLSVAQYEAMSTAGILTVDDRVELLEGMLVEKMTKNPPHRIATRRVRVALERIVPAGWYVDSQEPIVTTDSEPEPDACVIRGTTDDYADGNPEASNVALVVEIADSTLLRDRILKRRIYARAGIPIYWLIDLVARKLEVYSSPMRSGRVPNYRRRRIVREGGRTNVVIDGVVVGSIDVNALLPES